MLRVFRVIVLLLLYAAMIGLGAVIVVQSHESAHYEEQRVLSDNIEDNLTRMGKKIWQTVTFGLYEGYDRDMAELKRLQKESERARDVSIKAGLVFAGCAAAVLLIHLGGRYRHVRQRRNAKLVGHLLAIAFIALLVGVTAPVLTLVVQKDLPAVGRAALLYKTKGILTTARDLLAGGQYVVGCAILLFSVLMPVSKMTVMAVLLMGVDRQRHHLYQRVVKWTGKWSMADVFVIALLLTYFATDAQGTTRSELDVGLFFFVAYCLLSLIAASIHVDEVDGQPSSNPAA